MTEDLLTLLLSSMFSPLIAFVILIIVFGVLPMVLISALGLVAFISKHLAIIIEKFGKYTERIIPNDAPLGFILLPKKIFTILFIILTLLLIVCLSLNTFL